MKRDGGGRTTIWRALVRGPSPSQTDGAAVLHVLPVPLPSRPLVPGGLVDAPAVGEYLDWRLRPGRPVDHLGLAVGRLWRRAYRGRAVPES